MSTKNATLYDTDFYAWANEQAALLRAGRLSEADIENIAEEIESMGRSERRELVSRLTVLFVHLLKWRYQPDLRGRSWRLTIEHQRVQTADHLADNPSLKAEMDDTMSKAYRLARIDAERETHLPRTTFPASCPFTFEEALNADFWPDLPGLPPAAQRRYGATQEDTAMDFRADDVEYQRQNGQPLLARLYQPIGPGPFPAVLEVHGGAWTGGDRFNNVSIAEALAADGVVVLSIDFRMPPVARYPDTIADVNLGIRWLKANAEKFHSRADLVGALGTSSGGHMVLLSALRPTDPRYSKLPLDRADLDASVRFAIACWPVADPLERYRVKKAAGIERFVISHDKFWPSEADMEEASPTLILQRGETVAKPPVLIMQGTADDNLTPNMANNFAAAYASAGGSVVKEIFPDQPHAFIPAAPTSPSSLKALSMIKAFVHKHAG